MSRNVKIFLLVALAVATVVIVWSMSESYPYVSEDYEQAGTTPAEIEGETLKPGPEAPGEDGERHEVDAINDMGAPPSLDDEER